MHLAACLISVQTHVTFGWHETVSSPEVVSAGRGPEWRTGQSAPWSHRLRHLCRSTGRHWQRTTGQHALNQSQKDMLVHLEWVKTACAAISADLLGCKWRRLTSACQCYVIGILQVTEMSVCLNRIQETFILIQLIYFYFSCVLSDPHGITASTAKTPFSGSKITSVLGFITV